MKEFLNIAMLQNRTGVTERAKLFEEKFPRICALIVDKLGEKPFHIKRPLNTAALDSVFCTIMDNENQLVNELQGKYREMLEDPEFKEGTYYGTSDVQNIHRRFHAAIRHLVDPEL